MLRTSTTSSLLKYTLLNSTLNRQPLLLTSISAARRTIATSSSNKLQLTSEALQDHSEVSRDSLQDKRVFQRHPTDSAPKLTTSNPQDKSLTKETSHLHEQWLMYKPVYTKEEVNAVKIVRHERTTLTDKVASALVKTARFGFDFVTRYKHSSPEEAILALKKAGKSDLPLEQLIAQGYIMSKDQWMHRILFLESIAGVPGFVSAMLRHLTSLRLMRRDSGWIASLLQEAENERMHLMTFMKVKNPSKFFRFLVIATQGVFCNMFFLAYMISPKACHRFVAFLEEEAVVTYTQIVDEINRGHIPEWSSDKKDIVPQIALDYWRLPSDATMLDLMLAVRADEAQHRFLNHTLANLDGNTDVNPFASSHADPKLTGTLPGFTREQSLEWSKKIEDTFNRAKLEEKLQKESSSSSVGSSS